MPDVPAHITGTVWKAVLRPAALRWAGLLRAPAEAGRELFWYFGSYSCTSTPPGMVKYVTKPYP
ncbi:MAG: hypothetical protein E6J82_01790 [Deltaproteobacteria bacterium]|nr:MAG: hypothetical protein E6J82_01790 [Deltaproteobacteria bacterium]